MIQELPLPWHWNKDDLTKQLFRELPKKHVLEGKKLVSIGRRQDNDDALFEVLDDNYKYAVVHLTWAQKRLYDNRYPRTVLYKNWEDLYNNRILIDNADWE